MVKRIFNSEILNNLKPLFIEDGDYNKNVIYSEIKNRMENFPEDTFCCVVFDEKIKGFLIGWKLRNIIWLDQAFCTDRDMAKEAFKMFCDWSKDCGCNTIRMETERNASAIQKTWGFKEHSIVMELEL